MLSSPDILIGRGSNAMIPEVIESSEDLERQRHGRIVSRRCVATKSDGSPCGKSAIRGGTVCGPHGGFSPQVRNAAMMRLLAAAEPVAARLVDLATEVERPGEPCAACGRGMLRDEGIALKASTAVLDRAGLGPSSRLEVARGADEQPPWLAKLSPERALQVAEWFNEAKAAWAVEQGRFEENQDANR